MNRKLRCILTTLLMLSFAGLAHAQADTPPTKTIESALTEARDYAVAKEIDLNGKYIKRAEYHRNKQSKNERPYWSIYWINQKITKGGGVELRLYEDGSIEEKYYK